MLKMGFCSRNKRKIRPASAPLPIGIVEGCYCYRYAVIVMLLCYEAAEPEHYEKGELMSMSSLADEGGEDRYWHRREIELMNDVDVNA